MAYVAPTGVAGAEPPPERPSLAATHPQLFSRGNDILQSIMQIMSITPTEEGISAIVEGLPGFLDKVGDFVRDTLSSRGPPLQQDRCSNQLRHHGCSLTMSLLCGRSRSESQILQSVKTSGLQQTV